MKLVDVTILGLMEPDEDTSKPSAANRLRRTCSISGRCWSPCAVVRELFAIEVPSLSSQLRAKVGFERPGPMFFRARFDLKTWMS